MIERFRKERLPIYTDDATDYSGVRHLIAYERYVEETTINEDMLSRRPVKNHQKRNSSKFFMIS
jgi:hypothetical protein